jgi:hypothetical protein
LFGGERHSRCNNGVEEGGGSGGSVIKDGGMGARCDIFTNKVSCGFWVSRGFVRARWMYDEIWVCEGSSNLGSEVVTMFRGERGKRKDVININGWVKWGGVVGVKERVHDGVRYSRDIVPAKWRASEWEVSWLSSGREKRKDESLSVRGW